MVQFHDQVITAPITNLLCRAYFKSDSRVLVILHDVLELKSSFKIPAMQT